MKRYLIILGLVLTAGLATADEASLGVPANDFRLDMAVPESPALNVLANKPSRLLRPATVRDLGIAFEDFLNEDNQLRLPATFGAEFAPALMVAGPKLSLASYRAAPWLYRLRLSVATGEISQGGSARQLGVGLRTTLIDRSDLRNNDDFLAEAVALTDQINEILVAKRKEFGPLGPSLDEIQEMPGVKQAIADLTAAHRERWAEQAWNNTIWELAGAWGSSTSDSTISRLSTDNWAVWTTYGAGLGEWGHWLFGLTGESKRPAPGAGHLMAGTFATRLYAGGNKLKGFVEGQFTGMEESRPSYFFNGGGEVRIRKNLWFTFQLGYEENQETGNGDIRADIAINLGVWAFPLDLTKLSELSTLAGGG